MEYEIKGQRAFIKKTGDFTLKDTLTCGQCFRFVPLSENEYIIVAHEKVVHLLETKNDIQLYPTTEKDFTEIWVDYFDFNRDYGHIKAVLAENDPIMEKAIFFAGGIRLLNQQPWETLISFIISQNNHIPRIKSIIKNIAEIYGRPIEDDFYAFPTCKELTVATKEDLVEKCRTGFRARYIVDAVNKVQTNEVKLDETNIETDTMRKMLLSICGVGQKVADCVLLYGLGKKEVFPTDVWIKRAMEEYYFQGKEVAIKEIHEFAGEKFGSYGGFAQQYLFHYARQQKI